jgi:nicotinamidase-related amidase
MKTLAASKSLLLLVDFQTRLLPAIDGGVASVENARRLVVAADLLAVATLFTEQNPDKLGPTVPELQRPSNRVVQKMTFDALCAPEFPLEAIEDRAVVVTGCEAHVCVLQTVLGLLDRGRRAFVVADAVGSRREENKAAALRRMERHGAEIVTTEMALFEWLGSAEHPHFRDISRLIK